MNRFAAFLSAGLLLLSTLPAQEKIPDSLRFTLETCVRSYDSTQAEKTGAGSQFWFADRAFLDGRTLKMSIVAPHKATHAPHRHAEDEFFFVLEGTAEFSLAGKAKTVRPMTSLYCPPNVEHGIRNAGSTTLKYLVIKKYENSR
jgi:mannose-6-phosphate isomerase-like protein (cupin superfamily)